MAPAIWLSLLAASIVICITPGAGAINTMSNSLAVGWRRSIWGVFGQELALLVHIAIVAAGVGVLVANSPVLFNVIRYSGSAYLLYLGLRLIFTKPQPPAADAEGAAMSATRIAMLRRGFWVNLLNPKAIVFFLAFIPQFISADAPLMPQYLILIATTVGVDVIVMWGFFAVVARPFRRYTATARGQRVLNAIFGSLFVGVAALLLFLH
ncbi:LysE family transporter [Leucobacter sp. NPDC058333]|uniref:LysE family transporter n=1 Tax=Leucobacter sp. NPDC058333 TaxID=3346450 RepID=UPI003663E38C